MNRRDFILGSSLLLGCAKAGFTAPEAKAINASVYRPRVHYAPVTGFMNDPNGLLYYEGEYHLFYQHNPSSALMGNVHWGHAVSSDLLNWKTLPNALNNTSSGQAFSGSAVVDKNNSSHLFTDNHGGILLFYTRAGALRQVQELAYSADNGRTFNHYDRNPIIDINSQQFRDPKVFWYEPNQKWVMVVVQSRNHIVEFYESDNLRHWEKSGEFKKSGLLGIDYECPDLLAIEVESGKFVWVLLLSINPGAPLGGSTVQYFVGNFDGRQFTPFDHAARFVDFAKDFYAFQSFSGIEDAPVGLSWLCNWQYANQMPATPSRGMMTIPRKLGLLNFRGEWQLTQQFIDLSSQFNKTLYNGEKSLDAGGSWTVSLPQGEAVEITLITDIDVDTILSLTFANNEGESLSIGFDSSAFGGFFIDRHNTNGFDNPYYTDRFSYALPPNTTSTDMHIILDNSSIELLAAQGMASGTALYFTRAAFTSLTVHAAGGKGRLSCFRLNTLNPTSNAYEPFK